MFVQIYININVLRCIVHNCLKYTHAQDITGPVEECRRRRITMDRARLITGKQ